MNNLEGTIELPTPEDPNLIDLNKGSEGPSELSVSNSYAQKRAAMANVASKGSISLDETYNRLVNGLGEEETRRKLAQQEERNLFSMKTDVLNQYMKNLEGRPITSREADSIMSLKSKEDFQSDDHLRTAVERNYAKQIVDKTLATDAKVAEEFSRPDGPLDGVAQASQDQIARVAIAERIFEETKKKAEAQGWGGWAVDIVKTMIPVYTELKFRDRVEGMPGIGPVLPGRNLAEQITYLYGLPPKEMEDKLTVAVDTLARDNPALAQQFAEAFVKYGGSTQVLDNIFGALDFAAAGDLAKGGLKVTSKLVAPGRKALRDVAEETIKLNTKVEDVVHAMGDVDQAAVIKATKNLKVRSDLTKPEAIKEVFDTTGISIVDPGAWAKGSSRLSSAKAAEITKVLTDSRDLMLKAVSQPFGNIRVDDATTSFSNMVSKALDDVGRFNGVDSQKALLDVKYVTNEKAIDNVNRVQFDFGKPNKDLFQSAEEANVFATQNYNFKPGDYSVEQSGPNFFVRVHRELAENTDAVRDYILTPDNLSNTNPANAALGWFRSAEGVVSKRASAQRQVSVNAAEEVKALIDEAAKPLTNFLSNRTNYKNLNRYLQVESDARKFSTSAEEFETTWHQTFGKFPTEQERIAYSHAKMLNDLDHLVRNRDVYAHKVREGIRNVEVEIATGTENVRAFTKPIEAKIVDRLPKGGEQHRVMVIDEAGKPTIVDPMRLATQDREVFYKHLKDKNFKVAQVFDVFNPEMRKFITENDNAPINFIASKNIRVSSLSHEQVPYNPTGHLIYEQRQYIKQPRIASVFKDGSFSHQGFFGDTTWSAHQWGNDAKSFVKDLETARLMYKSGSSNLDSFVTRKLGMDVGEFKSRFQGEGSFNVNQPFFVADDKQSWKNVKGVDLKKEGIFDYTDSSFDLAAEMRTKFMGEKGMDLYDFRKGSTNSPAYDMVKAKQVDPLIAIKRSLNDIVDSVAYNDYRIRSANEWIEQFGHLIDGVPLDRLRANPMYYLKNGVLSKGNVGEYSAAVQAKIAINHLFSTPSHVKSTWEYVRTKALEGLHSIKPNLADYIDEKNLFQSSDPIKYMRAAAFHSNIGLFNPAHLFLQSVNLVNMAAVAPKFAFSAYKDAMIMGRLVLTESPDIIKYWAKHSKNPRFEETLKFIRESGFLNVNSNHAYIDAMAEPSVFMSKTSQAVGSFLDFGATFFRHGEQINRMGAINIAFREWADKAGKNAVMTTIERDNIMARANALTNNMTRASNAMVQNGIGSVPLQFWSYQWRIMEQMLTSVVGKGQFTRGEAARWLAASGAMYGIPIGVAGPLTGVWPWHESLEKAAQERGLNIDKNVMTETIFRGGFQTIVNHMLSDDQKYSISERFGPGGIPTFKQIADGEVGLSALAGVSGNTLGKFYQAVSPAVSSLVSTFSGPDKARPFSSDELLEALRGVSSVNNATKAWLVYNYQTYESRTGVPITGFNAGAYDLTLTALGVRPIEIIKFEAKKDVLKEQEKVIQELSKEIQREISRAFKSNSEEDKNKYFRNARIILEGAGAINEVQRANIFRSVIQKFREEDIAEVERRWATSAPNKETMDNRMNVMQENAIKRRLQ